MILIKESYSTFILKLVKIFNKLKVEYMIVGGASAIIQGYNGVTQDIDLYIDKNDSNQLNLIKALKQL